jgi:hypothetical protein
VDITTEIADELARETLEIVAKTGDDSIINQISQLMGASSQSLQEGYMTMIRVRRAEALTRKLLAEARAKAGA